jgi:hypothetical protein
MTREEFDAMVAVEERRHDAALAKARPKALALQRALSNINEGSIQVVCRDYISQKDRARLTRELFKSLGLKGVRVSVPRGVHSFWVNVSFPPLRHERGQLENRFCSESCEACIHKDRVRLALGEILLRAFPRHVDESDMQRDYFDPAWIIREAKP